MRVVILAAAIAMAGCGLTGPSDDLSGHWVANSGGRFSFVEIRLQQSGDEITGTACANSDGVLMYGGTPVVGDYPNLQFTVAANQTLPCCPVLTGAHFRGRQDSSKDIVGTYRGVDIRFSRQDRSFCS